MPMKDFSVPIVNENEEEGQNLLPQNFEDQSQEAEEAMFSGIMPEKFEGLPAQHPLWLVLGTILGLFRYTLKSADQKGVSGLDAEAIEKLEKVFEKKLNLVLERLPSEKKNGQTDLFGKIVPCILMLFGIGLFAVFLFTGGGARQSSSALTEAEMQAAIHLKSVLVDMAECRGKDFEKVGDYCTFRPFIQGDTLSTRGWKIVTGD